MCWQAWTSSLKPLDSSKTCIILSTYPLFHKERNNRTSLTTIYAKYKPFINLVPQEMDIPKSIRAVFLILQNLGNNLTPKIVLENVFFYPHKQWNNLFPHHFNGNLWLYNICPLPRQLKKTVCCDNCLGLDYRGLQQTALQNYFPLLSESNSRQPNIFIF